MKKVVSVVLMLCLILSLCACSKSDSGSNGGDGKSGSDYKVAMITDSGDITDQSFNQTTYEACKAFCDKNGIAFTYKNTAYALKHKRLYHLPFVLPLISLMQYIYFFV